jgi:hypothetical protein
VSSSRIEQRACGLLLALLLLLVPSAAGHALRRARPYRLELLGVVHDPLIDDPSPAAPPLAEPVIATDGALVVTPRPAPREGNRDPRAVRITDARGAVATTVEELAPELFRIAPRRRLRPGQLRIAGLDVARVRVARGGSAPTAPVLASVVNHRTPLDASQPAGPMQERVTVTLREAVPAGVIAIAARWVDWHDSEGGLYGAWRTLDPGASGELALICTAGLGCGDVHGHIPRQNERGELRYVDASGRLSPPTMVTVTTSP